MATPSFSVTVGTTWLTIEVTDASGYYIQFYGRTYDGSKDIVSSEWIKGSAGGNSQYVSKLSEGTKYIINVRYSKTGTSTDSKWIGSQTVTTKTSAYYYSYEINIYLPNNNLYNTVGDLKVQGSSTGATVSLNSLKTSAGGDKVGGYDYDRYTANSYCKKTTSGIELYDTNNTAIVNLGYGPKLEAKITYYPNTGTGNSTTKTYTSSSSPDTFTLTKLSTLGFYKTGYSFLGWATSYDGSVKYSDGDSVELSTSNHALFLYAKWKLAVASLTIKMGTGVASWVLYNSSGSKVGSGTKDNTMSGFNIGSSYTVTFTAEDKYTFNGSNTKNVSVTIVDGGSTASSGAAVLKATLTVTKETGIAYYYIGGAKYTNTGVVNTYVGATIQIYNIAVTDSNYYKSDYGTNTEVYINSSNKTFTLTASAITYTFYYKVNRYIDGSYSLSSTSFVLGDYNGAYVELSTAKSKVDPGEDYYYSTCKAGTSATWQSDYQRFCITSKNISSPSILELYYKTNVITPSLSEASHTDTTITVALSRNGATRGTWRIDISASSDFSGATSKTILDTATTQIPFTGLATGTTYYLRALHILNNVSAKSNTITITTRPSEFSWTSDDATNIVAGKDFSVILASRWNLLIDKIDWCLQHKGYGTSGQSDVSSGDNMTATLFNSMRNALAKLDSGVTGTKKSGEEVKANYFANAYESLKSTINRIISTF